MKKKFLCLFCICYCLSVLVANAEERQIYDRNDYKHSESGVHFENMYIKRSNMPKDRYYYPFVDGGVYARYIANFLDKNKTDYRDNGDNTSYFDIKSEVNVNLSRYFIVSSTFNISQSAKREIRYQNIGVYGSDFFNREGYLDRKSFGHNYTLKLEELYFNLATDDFMLGAGKYNPTFALAYDNTYYNGIMGTRFTEQYRLKEMNGVFTAMLLPFFTLRFNMFMEDTTFLSRSLVNSRGKSLKGYNAGNTKNLNSFSISSEFIVSDKYKINLGFRRLAVDDDKNVDFILKAERGYAVGLKSVFEIGSGEYGFNIYPSVEAVQIQNYRGENRRNLTFATINLPLIYDNWNLTFTESAKYDRNKNSGYSNEFSNLFEINIGYKFEFGLMLDVSRTFGKEYIKDYDYFSKIKNNKTYKANTSLDAWNFMISYGYRFF